MVLFLNKKEQVLEFELTPYGKHLFSQGKLDPKFYAFYDDDILYDSNYQTGTIDGAATAPLVNEGQNNIVTRINDTQRIGTITNFSELLTNNSIGEVSVEFLSDQFQQQLLEQSEGSGPRASDGSEQTRGKPIYMEKFLRPIGSNDNFKDFAPTWRVRSISGSTQFNNGYEYSLGIIPKLSASLALEYSTQVERVYDNNQEDFVNKDSYTLEKNERLLLDIQELNSTFKQDENFEIEVYKLREGGENRIQKLSFINDMSPNSSDLEDQTDINVFASLLSSARIDGTDEEIENSFIKLDETYVEYYLSIRVDDEIDDPLIPGSPLYGRQNIVKPEDPC